MTRGVDGKRGRGEPARPKEGCWHAASLSCRGGTTAGPAGSRVIGTAALRDNDQDTDATAPGAPRLRGVDRLGQHCGQRVVLLLLLLLLSLSLLLVLVLVLLSLPQLWIHVFLSGTETCNVVLPFWRRVMGAGHLLSCPSASAPRLCVVRHFTWVALGCVPVRPPRACLFPSNAAAGQPSSPGCRTGPPLRSPCVPALAVPLFHRATIYCHRVTWLRPTVPTLLYRKLSIPRQTRKGLRVRPTAVPMLSRRVAPVEGIERALVP